jgi:hypothetical protein
MLIGLGAGSIEEFLQRAIFRDRQGSPLDRESFGDFNGILLASGDLIKLPYIIFVLLTSRKRLHFKWRRDI